MQSSDAVYPEDLSSSRPVSAGCSPPSASGSHHHHYQQQQIIQTQVQQQQQQQQPHQQQKRGTATPKLHERIFTNIRLQRRGKNRRNQSVNSDCSSAVLQKCYSADENIMSAPMRGQPFDGDKYEDFDSTQQDLIYEDHCIVPHVHIRAASVKKLVEELLNHLDLHSNFELLITEENIVFPRIFFLVHSWFTNTQMIGKLLVSHAECHSLYDSSIFIEPHDNSIGNTKLFKVDTITLAFCLWIEFYSNDFMGDASCMPVLSQFMEQLQSANRIDLVSALEKCLNASYDWSRCLSVRISTRCRGVIKLSSATDACASLVFNEIQPCKIAEQLTVIEFKAFRRITIQDLKAYAVTCTVRDIPRLERSVYLFNGMSQWVQCMILNKTTPLDRARVLERFLQIAKHLLQLQNYNSFYAIIGGITHSTISRLTITMSLVTPTAHKMLEDFSTLISSANNFSNYRQLQKESKGFHIPVLAVHLKDLIFYHTALPDYHEKWQRLVNFRKFAQLASTLQLILEQQLMQMAIHHNVDLCNTLRLSLDLQYTEEEIYELSLAREPRSNNDAPSTSKNVLFAEFVTGVKPPTAQMLKQHVYDMVEAVFKVHDHDKDGLISSDEFDQVAENFPFIDSFAVLDADNDGVISKQEMTTYFLKANYNALKNSFKHGFYENTYFKPTFCAHCTGLLWGIIKQGWRCRDCGLNVHKHCKDQVVMECRPRVQSSSLGGQLRPSMLSPDSGALGNGGGSQMIGSSGLDFHELNEPITLNQKRRMSQRRRNQRKCQDVETQTVTCIQESEDGRGDGSARGVIAVPLSMCEALCFIDEEHHSEEAARLRQQWLNQLERARKDTEELERHVRSLEKILEEREQQVTRLTDTIKCMKIKVTDFVLEIMSIFAP